MNDEVRNNETSRACSMNKDEEEYIYGFGGYSIRKGRTSKT